MNNESNEIGNGDQPVRPSAPTTKSNCLRVAGITCLVVVVIGILIGVWIFNALSKNPAFQKAYKEAQLRTQCKENLEEIGGALQRYSRRNGKYPATLAELCPNFLENEAALHCPADRRPDPYYEYYAPAVDALPTAVVAECKRHTVLENQPPWKLSLRKDGKVILKGYSPRGGPPEPPVGD